MAHLVASPTSSPRYLTRRAAKLSKSMNDLLVMWLFWVISSFSVFLFNVFAPSSVVVVGHGNGQKWRARQPSLSCNLVMQYIFMLWGGYYLWYVPSYQKFKASAIKISCPLSSKTASRHLVHNYCTYQYAWKFLSVPAAAKWMNQKYSLFNLISSLCWMMWIDLYYVIALTLALASEP